MAYTTTTLISNKLQRTLTSNESALLIVIIPAIKLFIDHKLNTTFDLATPQARLYDSEGAIIAIDPCTDVTLVKSVDEYNATVTSYVASDYVLEPINETIKTQIRFRYGHSWRGVANVSVLAKFSEYEQGVPEDIQSVATMIAAGVIYAASIQSNSRGIKSEDIEGHKITYDSAPSSIAEIVAGDGLISGILELRNRPLVC